MKNITSKTKHKTSREFIEFTITIILWTAMFTFLLSVIIFNQWIGGASSKITFAIIATSISLLFLFMGYKRVYKPIKQLEVAA